AVHPHAARSTARGAAAVARRRPVLCRDRAPEGLQRELRARPRGPRADAARAAPGAVMSARSDDVSVSALDDLLERCVLGFESEGEPAVERLLAAEPALAATA